MKHELSNDQHLQLNEVIATFENAPKEGELGCTDRTKHVIDTGESKPIKQKQYVLSRYVQDGVVEEINRMLARGIIRKIDNPTWLNPVVAVRKPNGKIRLCLDARRLNDATIKNAYPQPNANRILSLLTGTQYLTAIDLSDKYR